MYVDRMSPLVQHAVRYVMPSVTGQRWRYVVYAMDNRLTNPYSIWQQQGSPVFPNRRQLQQMRQAQVWPPCPKLTKWKSHATWFVTCQ